MPTIKERRQLLQQQHRDYLFLTYKPAMQALTEECELEGHINLQTKTRDDGSQYYVCDNCGKQVELSV